MRGVIKMGRYGCVEPVGVLFVGGMRIVGLMDGDSMLIYHI